LIIPSKPSFFWDIIARQRSGLVLGVYLKIAEALSNPFFIVDKSLSRPVTFF